MDDASLLTGFQKLLFPGLLPDVKSDEETLELLDRMGEKTRQLSQLIDLRRAAIQRNPGYSTGSISIGRFPDEVIVMIFKFGFSENLDGVRDVLAWTRVSVRFRSIAYHIPSLWTVLSNSMHMKHLDLSFRLSRSHNFHVFINQSKTEAQWTRPGRYPLTAFLEKVTMVFSRWETFTYSIRVDDFYSLKESNENLLCEFIGIVPSELRELNLFYEEEAIEIDPEDLDEKTDDCTARDLVKLCNLWEARSLKVYRGIDTIPDMLTPSSLEHVDLELRNNRTKGWFLKDLIKFLDYCSGTLRSLHLRLSQIHFMDSDDGDDAYGHFNVMLMEKLEELSIAVSHTVPENVLTYLAGTIRARSLKRLVVELAPWKSYDARRLLEAAVPWKTLSERDAPLPEFVLKLDGIDVGAKFFHTLLVTASGIDQLIVDAPRTKFKFPPKMPQVLHKFTVSKFTFTNCTLMNDAMANRIEFYIKHFSQVEVDFVYHNCPGVSL